MSRCYKWIAIVDVGEGFRPQRTRRLWEHLNALVCRHDHAVTVKSSCFNGTELKRKTPLFFKLFDQTVFAEKPVSVEALLTSFDKDPTVTTIDIRLC